MIAVASRRMRTIASWKASCCVLLSLLPIASSAASFTTPTATVAGTSSATRRNMSSAATTSSSSSSCPSSLIEVAQIPCLSDNYGYLIHDPASGQTAAIDTPCADTYKKELAKRGWKLTHILNTHHHWDHTGGNLELKKEGGVTVYGPVNEKEKIPGLDIAVGEGDVVEFGSSGAKAKVMDVGGHTHGHIAYYFESSGIVFVGDSLFALGCGKMFEGNPQQFWKSLNGLRSLPDETSVYCAHEYTESNARFAMSVEPSNPKLVARVQEIKSKRAKGEPTVPSLMGEEKATNPFLRVDVSDEIRKNVGAAAGEPNDVVFGKVRHAKDVFRG